MDDQNRPKTPPNLRARGRRLWRQLHESTDFDGVPETVTVVEEACYLADEVDRLRKIVRDMGDDRRIQGYGGAGHRVEAPEVDSLRKTQALMLSMLKAVRTDETTMTTSDFARRGATARWNK